MAGWLQQWGASHMLVLCQGCDWLYLSPSIQTQTSCPHCGDTSLTPLAERADEPIYTHPPELIVPFTLSRSQASERVKRFLKGNWLPPHDAAHNQLMARLQCLYIPMWLTDSDVTAKWQAEVGFDYEVVTHREIFVDDVWRSQQLEETRVRWEARVGLLQRHYTNTPSPALEEHGALMQRLRHYSHATARPYQADALAGALVRLPNRPPADAQADVHSTLKQQAMAECQQATAADHIREFRWASRYDNVHWTQLLLPVYSTYYQDDNGTRHVLLINGQTGLLSGAQRASMRRALRFAVTVGAIATLFFLLGVLAPLVGGPAWESVAQESGGLAFLGFLIAVFPLIYVWQFNHNKHFYQR